MSDDSAARIERLLSRYPEDEDVAEVAIENRALRATLGLLHLMAENNARPPGMLHTREITGTAHRRIAAGQLVTFDDFAPDEELQ